MNIFICFLINKKFDEYLDVTYSLKRAKFIVQTAFQEYCEEERIVINEVVDLSKLRWEIVWGDELTLTPTLYYENEEVGFIKIKDYKGRGLNYEQNYKTIYN